MNEQFCFAEALGRDIWCEVFRSCSFREHISLHWVSRMHPVMDKHFTPDKTGKQVERLMELFLGDRLTGYYKRTAWLRYLFTHNIPWVTNDYCLTLFHKHKQLPAVLKALEVVQCTFAHFNNELENSLWLQTKVCGLHYFRFGVKNLRACPSVQDLYLFEKNGRPYTSTEVWTGLKKLHFNAKHFMTCSFTLFPNIRDLSLQGNITFTDWETIVPQLLSLEVKDAVLPTYAFPRLYRVRIGDTFNPTRVAFVQLQPAIEELIVDSPMVPEGHPFFAKPLRTLHTVELWEVVSNTLSLDKWSKQQPSVRNWYVRWKPEVLSQLTLPPPGIFVSLEIHCTDETVINECLATLPRPFAVKERTCRYFEIECM